MNSLKKVIFENVEYEVNGETGSVVNVLTNLPVVESMHSDGKRKLMLKRQDGNYKPVESGLFILWAFDKFWLPKQYWDKATYWFHDDEDKSHRHKNLYVLHKEPIEYNGYTHGSNETFYYVPGYELNAINWQGQIIRLATGTFYNPSDECLENPDDYIYVRTNKKPGKQTNLMLHRLMALTFNEPPINYPKLHVDHLNGMKNDFLSHNLQWVTPKENIERAILNNQRADTKTTLVKVIATGEVHNFVSAARAAEFMGITPKLLNRNFSIKKHIVDTRYLVKYEDDAREWDELKTATGSYKCNGVKAKNILTGEISVFSSIRETSKQLKISESAVVSTLIQGEVKFLKQYELKDAEDETEWSVFPEHKIELARRGLSYNTKVYDLINTLTGVVERHYDLKELAKQLGVIPRNIWYAANRNGVIHRTYKVKEIN